MRDLIFYADECRRELDRLGIPYSKNITFKVNTRAKMRLGVCKKTGNSFVIAISSSLLDERTPLKEGLKNTLHHELLHTCRGCMKHTGRWKIYADRVNAAYGYCIKRAAEKDEGIIPGELMKKPRYRVVCPGCGTVYERFKRSKLIDHPEQYRCGKCKTFLARSDFSD